VRQSLPQPSATPAQCWAALGVPTGISEVLRPCRAAPALMDEQPWPGALSMLLIAHCHACSWLRCKLVGGQGDKWGPQSPTTDLAATLTAADKKKAKEKFQCEKTQGKMHTFLSKAQGKCHQWAELQMEMGSSPKETMGRFLPCAPRGAPHSAGRRPSLQTAGGTRGQAAGKAGCEG